MSSGSSRLSTRLLRPQNTSLQICFLNETSSDSEAESHNAAVVTTGSSSSQLTGQEDEGVDDLAASIGGTSIASTTQDSVEMATGNDDASSGISLKPLDFRGGSARNSSEADSLSAIGSPSNTFNADFVSALVERYALLRKEANIAYAQAARMAVMQLQVEKEMSKYRKKPTTAEKMVPGFCDWLQVQNAQHQMRRFQHNQQPSTESPKSPHALQRYLASLPIAQLQLILNQMRSEIDNQNQELVNLLEERDDLHTAQDARLVDIDDLSGRLQEKAERLAMPGGVSVPTLPSVNSMSQQFHQQLGVSSR